MLRVKFLLILIIFTLSAVVITPYVFAMSDKSILLFNEDKRIEKNAISFIQPSSQEPSQRITYSGKLGADIRVVVLNEYFRRHNSPLEGYAQTFVDACDYFGAPRDCLTVAAIARNESYLCTYKYSAEMHNCWGFGGGGQHRQEFSSFDEGIQKVTDILVNQYGTIYMEDPRKMEHVFCGQDPGCSGWGSSILYFMNEINQLSIEMGYGSLINLR